MVIPIEHTEITEKVYRVLKQMILNRDFVGGQKLNLNELSAKMQISRTPLKDAINRLVSEGLIEVKARSGTFVTKITADDIKHVMEMRAMIELWCIARLNGHMASVLADKLKPIVHESSKLLADTNFSYEGYVELDVAFHEAIVATSQNPKVLETYRSLNSFLKISRVFYFKSQERSQMGQWEHEEIVGCLERFELESAKTKLNEHIEKSKHIMIRLLEENGGSI
jgi:DNA-binding GntR family transcriptional regulator